MLPSYQRERELGVMQSFCLCFVYVQFTKKKPFLWLRFLLWRERENAFTAESASEWESLCFFFKRSRKFIDKRVVLAFENLVAFYVIQQGNRMCGENENVH